MADQIAVLLFPFGVSHTWSLSIKKFTGGGSKLTSRPSLFSDTMDLILLLLLQGDCSFKSFWLLSSECPCALLMGLIWYSAPMPSLIFVCETKCFDGGWLLKRLRVHWRLLFLFSLFLVSFYGLSRYSTVCAFCSKTRTQPSEFWIRFIILPSSQQLCCQRAVCIVARVCLCAVFACVLDACGKSQLLQKAAN